MKLILAILMILFPIYHFYFQRKELLEKTNNDEDQQLVKYYVNNGWPILLTSVGKLAKSYNLKGSLGDPQVHGFHMFIQLFLKRTYIMIDYTNFLLSLIEHKKKTLFISNFQIQKKKN